MTATRRQKIEAMLQDDPSDTFLNYALASELKNDGDIEACLQRLSQLTQISPPYIPAFFMAGRVLAEVSRISEARSALRDGIEEARRQGDFHAAGEMAELLAELGALGE